MKRRLAWLLGLLIGAAIALPGCSSSSSQCNFATDLTHYQQVATEIEYPTVATCADENIFGTRPPRTISDLSEVAYWNLSLQEAIRLALIHSKVMLDLGGTVLRSPDSLQTSYGVAVHETDPQFGTEAALAAFDAEFSTSMLFQNNDSRLNNRFLGNLGFFQQDYDVFQTQITKRAVTGSQFAVRENVDFDDNNNVGNQFRRGAWDVALEGEVRHPLLQGSGIEFNRIAGPGARPGVFNGVLVARVRTDTSLADFEMGLRDFVSNVENAYWDLYFAYRDLDTKIKARNTALETWRRVYALHVNKERGGEADKEAQAREQYFHFEEDVQNALAGRPLEGTRTNNGSSPGTFRGISGVYISERKLRLLMGLPANDCQLIRPADEPLSLPMVFDWCSIAGEALVRREELRRQKWQVKSRELELLASKNFLLPNLDLVGRYRWRGFGEKLIDSDRNGKEQFDNAFMDLTSGKFQEWQMGAELSVPIGFRQAHAALRNAELRLCQARAILREQERQVVHDLSNAVAEVDRAYTVLQTDVNRVIAAKEQLALLQEAYQNDRVEFFVVLDAQRRYADAESTYYQSRVAYALALRNVHYEKGSLLEYCEIALSEGPWPCKAYQDAADRRRLRGRPRSTDYGLRRPPLVSQGSCLPQAAIVLPLVSPPGAGPAGEQPPEGNPPPPEQPSDPNPIPPQQPPQGNSPPPERLSINGPEPAEIRILGTAAAR